MAEKFRILVVEDDPDDLALIKMALKDEPYEILVAHNGKEGCLLYTSPSPRDRTRSRMPSSA